MSRNKCIIPECYIDSCLVEVLLFAGKNHVNHQKGNGTVAGEMKEKFNDAFCIGIIDEDRKPLDYLKAFTLIAEISSSSLKLWQHGNKHHYLIQICPVLEKWIIDECTEKNIQLPHFGLPADLKDLMRVSKSVASKNDLRFIALFKMMLSKGCASVVELKRWIDYLKQKNYQIDINELKNV